MKSAWIGLGALAFASAAAASPCADKIVKLQARFNAMQPAGTAPAEPQTSRSSAETTAAKLHREPTTAVIPDVAPTTNSETALHNARFRNNLFDAQAAENAGDVRGCEAAVAAAEKEISR